MPGLSFGDLAALEAGGADAQALGGAVDQRADGLEVRVPAAAGDVVRVRNVVAELRTLAANITNLCHDVKTPNLNLFASIAVAARMAFGGKRAAESERGRTITPAADCRMFSIPEGTWAGQGGQFPCRKVL